MIWAKSSWNGHHDKACEALGRIAGWAKDASVLNDPAMGAGARRLVARCMELQAYIESNEGALIDYGQRHRAGKPISTSRAEGTVNQLVSLTLAFSGWVACGFGEAVEERAWDCCHVLGVQGR